MKKYIMRLFFRHELEHLLQKRAILWEQMKREKYSEAERMYYLGKRSEVEQAINLFYKLNY